MQAVQDAWGSFLPFSKVLTALVYVLWAEGKGIACCRQGKNFYTSIGLISVLLSLAKKFLSFDHLLNFFSIFIAEDWDEFLN